MNQFALKYLSNSELIGSCNSSELKENLIIISNTELNNTWQACDGPFLVYNRIE